MKTWFIGVAALVAACGPATGTPDGGVLDAGTCADGFFPSGGRCTAWKTCAEGEFVETAGSSTDDRRCAACAMGTFSATKNAMRCSAWTTCVAGQVVSRVGGANADRACMPCAAGTYTSGENETACLSGQSCMEGFVERTPATSTAAATCTACQPGNFCPGGSTPPVPCAAGLWDHDARASTPCVAKSECQAGQLIQAEGGPTADRSCAPCAAGTFSQTPNAATCAPWRTCPAGTNGAAGTASTDRACTACVSGTFSTSPNATCLGWTPCAPGTFITTPGTAASDQSCAACAAGTFSRGNAMTCTPWASCVAGQFMVSDGTPAQDRVCRACSGGYSVTANALACTPWTNCPAGTSTSPQATPSTDRGCVPCATASFSATTNAATCVPWTTCVPGQFEQSIGTATGNRTCVACPVGQTTTTSNAAACVAGAFLSGEVRGLVTTGLVLQNNLGATLSIAASGRFIFPTPVPIGTAWTVTVQTQPGNAPACTVSQGAGTLSANVSNIVVECGVPIRVTTEGGGPVPSASIVLVGPSLTVEASADSAGVIRVGFPANQRPLSMTVAAPDHEALSIIGLSGDLPDEVFIAPTVPGASTTAPLTGAISGKSAPANRVNVDIFDGNTVTTTAAMYTSFYSLAASAAPVQVVALEVGTGDVLLNWVASGPFSRTAGGHTFDVAFPSPAAPIVTTSLSVTPAATGLFTATTVASMTRAGFTAHYVGNSASALDGGSAYVLSGWVQPPVGGIITSRGVTGPLMPNRALVSLNGSTSFLRLWVRDPFMNPSNVLTAPEVSALTSSGTGLNTVAAQASAVGFDTLELQISSTIEATTYWRVYTAPGAPLTIARLPPLPTGITPASLGIVGSVTALPLLIRFAEPSTRPWQLPGVDTTYPYYSTTAAAGRRVVTSAWP